MLSIVGREGMGKYILAYNLTKHGLRHRHLPHPHPLLSTPPAPAVHWFCLVWFASCCWESEEKPRNLDEIHNHFQFPSGLSYLHSHTLKTVPFLVPRVTLWDGTLCAYQGIHHSHVRASTLWKRVKANCLVWARHKEQERDLPQVSG